MPTLVPLKAFPTALQHTTPIVSAIGVVPTSDIGSPMTRLLSPRDYAGGKLILLRLTERTTISSRTNCVT